MPILFFPNILQSSSNEHTTIVAIPTARSFIPRKSLFVAGRHRLPYFSNRLCSKSPPSPTMIRLGKTRLLLRDFDQSHLSSIDLEEGEELTIQHEVQNCYDSHAVVVQKQSGRIVSRVAREKSRH